MRSQKIDILSLLLRKIYAKNSILLKITFLKHITHLHSAELVSDRTILKRFRML
jgi:hypothetical protein